MDPNTWCLVVIYIGYWSVIDSLWWDVESIIEFDSKGVSTFMSPNGPCFELIFFFDTTYEGWMSF